MYDIIKTNRYRKSEVTNIGTAETLTEFLAIVTAHISYDDSLVIIRGGVYSLDDYLDGKLRSKRVDRIYDMDRWGDELVLFGDYLYEAKERVEP